MSEYDVTMLLMQAEQDDLGLVLRDWMRGMVRQTVPRVFEVETQALCGALYRPDERNRKYGENGSCFVLTGL